MPLDRLTQITSSGISSNSTITVSAISGIVTATSATISGNLTVSAGSTSAPSISPSGDSNTGIFFPAPDTVAIGEGGSEVIRINSSGNVGLGTINPSARLHSLGATSSAATYIINRSTAYATGSVTNYYHYVSEQGTFTGGTVYTQYGYYVGNLSGAAYNYGVYSNLSAGSNKWNFYADGTANNYFAGNVLVGSATSTGTASQPLQVTGGAYVSGNVGLGTINPTVPLHIQKNSGELATFEITDAASAYFSFISQSTKFGYVGSASGFITTGTRVDLALRSNNNLLFSIGNTERLRLNSSGNFLINTTTATGTASQPLQVTGGAYISGNLGIGSTNPQEKLDVQGGNGFVRIGEVYTSYNGITLNNSTTDANYNFISSPADTSLYINRPSGAAIYFRMNNSDQMTLDNGAGLTIGGGLRIGSTSNPSFTHEGWRGLLDRAWDNYPSITIRNTTDRGPQGEFRIHGIDGANGGDFSIVTRCDGGYQTGSDARRKTNIETISNALEIVNNISGKRFNIINKNGDIEDTLTASNGKKFGFIAQEVIDHIPEVVKYYPEVDAPNENGWANAYSIDYSSVVALLTEAVKELSSKNKDLEDRIKILESQINN